MTLACDITTGTFTTRDPLDGVPATPTTTNPYHYADNDPLNRVDPLGLRPCDKESAVNGKKLSCEDIADAYVDAVSSELQFSFLFPLVNVDPALRSLWDVAGAGVVVPHRRRLGDSRVMLPQLSTTPGVRYGLVVMARRRVRVRVRRASRWSSMARWSSSPGSAASGTRASRRVGRGVERPAGLVLEDQVVEAGVEGLCDAGERADAGGDAPVFVSGDLAAVAADAIDELGLGPAGFDAQDVDSFTEWRCRRCPIPRRWSPRSGRRRDG